MNDQEISLLKAQVERKRRVLWNPNCLTARVVVGVADHAEEGKDSPCALFANGEYAALYNCSLDEFCVTEKILDAKVY